MKRPPPFKPLSSVARSTLPEQNKPIRIADDSPVRRVTIDTPSQIVEATINHREIHPVLTITADITIPQSERYARRLQYLLRSLQASLEEEAPWLANIEINVTIPAK